LTNTEEPSGGGGWTYYKITWLMRPDAPWYANDNPAYPAGDGSIQFQGDNTVVMSDANLVGLTTTKDKRYNGTLRLEYQIPGIKGLSAKALYDYTVGLPDWNTYRRSYNLYQYNPGNTTYSPIAKSTPSRINKRTELNYDRTMQGGLYYSNSFNKHNINSFLIYEQTYIQRDGFSAQRDLQINSQYLFAGEQTNQSATGITPFDRSSKSLVGSVAYDFDRKYMLNFSFRYEGSSRFPAGSRFGFFPTMSAAWRLGEEGFIKNNFDFISELKIRASYGELGDDASAGNYPPVIGYNLAGNDVGWYFGDVLNGGVAASDIPNPKLTWYLSKSYDAGLDFGFLQDKITGTIDVFKRDRSGLLARRLDVIPGTVGAQLPLENLNGDRNFGYEISATYRNRARNFYYYATGNIGATKYMRRNWLETPANNTYDKWRNRTADRYQNIWWGNGSGGMFTSLQDIRTFYRPMGQGALPGDWWLTDWNGDGVVDNNDQHPIATTGLPIFNYGISLGGSWRNFDVAMDWQGAKGVNVQYGEVLVEALGFGGQNTLTYFMDRWRPEDPNADYFNSNTKWIPGYYPVTGHDGRRTGTNGIMNASYIRLKTAELGYTFNSKLLSRAGIKDMRVFLSGYNILTFTPLKNVDPERPGINGGGASTSGIDFYNDPITKTYTIGAKLKF
jgi:TonB-linked SusC/RagA family outer membrane protein